MGSSCHLLSEAFVTNAKVPAKSNVMRARVEVREPSLVRDVMGLSLVEFVMGEVR